MLIFGRKFADLEVDCWRKRNGDGDYRTSTDVKQNSFKSTRKPTGVATNCHEHVDLSSIWKSKIIPSLETIVFRSFLVTGNED